MSSCKSNKECARLAPSAVAVAVPTSSADVAVRGLFEERRERDLLDRADGTLRIGIELAQGFDGIAEQFEADGPLGLSWKNVHDPTAHRELAGHFHHVMRFIADAAKVRDEFVERNGFITGKPARLVCVVSCVG